MPINPLNPVPRPFPPINRAPQRFSNAWIMTADAMAGKPAFRVYSLLWFGFKGLNMDELLLIVINPDWIQSNRCSLLLGWELMALCLGFLAPSLKFQSYLELYISRTLEARDFTDQVIIISLSAVVVMHWSGNCYFVKCCCCCLLITRSLFLYVLLLCIGQVIVILLCVVTMCINALLINWIFYLTSVNMLF